MYKLDNVANFLQYIAYSNERPFIDWTRKNVLKPNSKLLPAVVANLSIY